MRGFAALYGRGWQVLDGVQTIPTKKAHASLPMFCRIEIFNASNRLICTHYQTGRDIIEIEQIAERDRRLHDGNAFRIRDMHTDQVKIVRPDMRPQDET